MGNELNRKPTDGELEILQVLWQKGPVTVREVFETLAEKKEVGYTTVLKLMQIMIDKGLLRRDTTSRSHLYEATLSQGEAQNALLDRIMDSAFGGSALRLVMQALDHHQTSDRDLAEIRAYLDRKKGEEP
jgi:predicted transcriptional regulator